MKSVKSIVLASAIVIGSTQLTGCGYNTLQMQNQQVNASWAEVVNQYQRRYDLIPNLVNTVKGYANHEKSTLTAVTNARSKVGSIQVSPSTIDDPQQMQKYIDAQAQLTGSLSRLMAVTENYPDLKAAQNFQDLATQLEGTENRIAVARGRYIESVMQYNTNVKSFPTNITAKIFGLKEHPQFQVAADSVVMNSPEVKFDAPDTSAAPASSSSSNQSATATAGSN